MTATCVVQARTGSTRLPGKVLAGLGGRPMLRFMLDRLAPLRVDSLVVATTDLRRDDTVAQVAREAGAAVVRGPEQDVLARFAMVLESHPAGTVVRLTADCPLVDPNIVASVVDRHRHAGADYTCNVLPRTFPRGLDVEVMSAPALRAAAEEATLPEEREHVTPFLYRHPERFRLANVRSGELLGGERWTVDTADDLRFVREVVAGVAHLEDPGWREVLAVAGRRAPAPVRSVRLRPAAETDSHLLLSWRNDPDAVRFSVSGRAVRREEHRAWLAERLAGPGTRLHIGEVAGRPIGQVRVEVRAGVGEVSLIVAAEARRRGWGRALLRCLQDDVCGDLQVRRLEATIAVDHRASLECFEAVGFRPVQRAGPRGFMVLAWDRFVADLNGPPGVVDTTGAELRQAVFHREAPR